MSHSVFEFVIAIVELILASILLLYASYTLCRINKHKQFRFLRFMTIVVVFATLFQLTDAALIVAHFSHGLLISKRIDSTFYFIIIGGLVSLHELSIFIVVWFVTFKYWETARQVVRFHKISLARQQREAGDLKDVLVGSTESQGDLVLKLTEKHEKYNILKWGGFSLLTGIAIA